MKILELVVAVVALAAAAAALLRWLRVSQREHYLPGAPIRFAWRWWTVSSSNGTALVLGIASVVAAWCVAPIGFVGVAVVACCPLGLQVRGRTSRLAWTSRLRRVAAATVVIVAACVALGSLGGVRGAMLAAIAVGIVLPLLLDLALRILAPFEERMAQVFVTQAKEVLGRVRPRIVAITGSYGKTSTKGYVAHLLSGRFQVIASPRSFNNRAGLARTVNELLVPGTDVLIAEMGTYGPGEIAAMVEWLPPDVAVITAIGPVHLERFKTLERTLLAKREIAKGAQAVVLNVDNPLLARLAAELTDGEQRVIGCSASRSEAEVALLEDGDHLELYVGGGLVGPVHLGERGHLLASTNIACAVGVALAFGIDPSELLIPLESLPIADNRLTTSVAASGAVILDDTFNSNPAGARLALRALAERAERGRRVVVVTPGMIELGPRQHEENADFAALATTVATDFVVVGRTNRAALRQGVTRDGAETKLWMVRDREEAVSFVRAELGAGDAVLYENDLPDHFA